MRIAFFGSEDFSVPSLQALLDSGHEVVVVVTKADRQKGRGLSESPTVVAEMALSLGIPVLKPEKLKSGGFYEALFSFSPELSVVCAYGKILNTEVLACPVRGCINVHPSLLPKYRGATPIESAIRAGDSETGVSIFYMDEGCDTGDIILQKTFPISPDDDRGALREKLAPFSARVLAEAVDRIARGAAQRIPQPGEGAVCTSLIEKEDYFVDWSLPARDIRNFARSLWPRPGCRTRFRNKLILLSPMEIVDEDFDAEPGVIVRMEEGRRPVVAAGAGALKLKDVKPEGKKLMSAIQFSLGARPEVGERFGR